MILPSLQITRLAGSKGTDVMPSSMTVLAAHEWTLAVVGVRLSHLAEPSGQSDQQPLHLQNDAPVGRGASR